MRKITGSRAEPLTIGKLSKLTGVNIETIRYYERIGVVPAVPRTKSGRRIYGATETRMLSFVRRARELGFSLDEVRTLLKLGGPDKASCRDVRDIAKHHRDNIRTKMADLRRLDDLLTQTIAKCTGTTAPQCPILDVLDVHQAMQADRSTKNLR